MERIAAYIAEIDSLAPQMPSAALTRDLHGIAECCRDLLAFISDMPEAFDANAPWWSEWLARSKPLIHINSQEHQAGRRAVDDGSC
ncbi:hypothetical protein ACTJKY_08195 [Sphingomonas sp. 22176]